MKKFYSKLMALMLVFTFAFSTYAVRAEDAGGTPGTQTETEVKKEETGADGKKDTEPGDTKKDEGTTDDTKDDGKKDDSKDDSKDDGKKDDSKDDSKDDGKKDDSKDDSKDDGKKDDSKDDSKDDGKKDDSKDDSKDDGKKDDSKDDSKDDGKKDDKPAKTTPDDVAYKVKADDYVTFSASDFSAQYKEITGEAFTYLQITKLPSSSYGTLYYNYDTKNQEKVTTKNKLTSTYLNKISFVASKKGSVTIPYTMYGKGKSLSGNIVITINAGTSASSSQISYTVDEDDYVKFRAADFKTACTEATGKTLDYVKFTLPSSSKGTLYYDYDGSDEAKVTANKKYYASDTPSLNKVYFVPKSGASGTISISFTGMTTNEKTFTGTVKIKMSASSSSSSSTIKYSVKSTSEVDFKVRDFERVCSDETGSDLTKIVFTSLPSSSKGKLYLGYKSSSRYDDVVSDSEDYYVDDDPAISDITFVPKSTASGTVTIKYKGYYSRTKYYEGSIQIKITKSSTTDDEDDDDDTISTLSLTTSKNKPVSFNASSISSAYKKATNKTLSYVKFSAVSSSYGKLYYDYDGDDEDAVSSSDKYYASKNPYIKNVSFVPAKNYTGTVTVSYSAYASSGSYTSGKIKITVKGTSSSDDDNGNSGSADVALGVVKNKSVTFTVSPFNVASLSVTDDSIRSVRFGAVNSSYGKLYYNYGTASEKEVPAGAVFNASSEPYISGVSFVPTKGYKGNVTFSYTGTNTSGESFTGVVRLTVASYKKLFSDVTEDKWYYDTVNTVCDADLMRGNSETTFNPEGSMTLAEAITMGARLYNSIRGGTDVTFTASATGNWYDVYVDFAIKNGIIRSDDFSDYSRIASRAEMAYIFYHSVTPAYLSAINSWTVPDVSTTDKYGTEIYSLYNAGILTGSDAYGTFNASSGITRAEAAAILGRTGRIIDRIKK